MVDGDLALVAPDVVEEVLHDEPRLVPHELVVALHARASAAAMTLHGQKTGARTSENAGAVMRR